MPKPTMPTTAREWNDRYPRGTLVVYFPQGKGTAAKSLRVKTRGAAYHNSSGDLFVPLEGLGAAKRISSIELVPPPEPMPV